YTGNTVVNGGTLALVAAGTALSSASFLVNPGATLALDNNGNANTTSVNLGSRSAAAANITLKAGTLNFLANSANGMQTPLRTTMVAGPITLGPGQSTIQAGYATAPASGSTATLTVSSLSRNASGTVNFIGNSGGGTNANLDGAVRIAFV